MSKEIVNSDNNKKNEKKSVVFRSAQSTVHFSGPLPPPEILGKYDQISPGAAKIIIEMADRQAGHRQGLENRVINSDIFNSRIGLIFGFIIGMTGIISGALLVYFGKTASGILLSGTTILSLVGTFVYGSQGRRKEREEKQD